MTDVVEALLGVEKDEAEEQRNVERLGAAVRALSTRGREAGAAAVPVVKVKPLEWKDMRGHAFPDMWCAVTPCGVYDIEERSASDSPAYVALGPHYLFIADKDSLDAAKAAAQADYEARILSALATEEK